MPDPVYRQLQRQLREEIENGVYQRMLPPEQELIKKYGVSRGTLREAVRLLEEDGWVERQQGRGTLVLRDYGQQSRRPSPPISAIENFEDWKSLQRLPTEFPRLLPLKWDELDKQAKMYIRHPRQTRQVERILLAAETPPSIQPHTVVLVNRGHGCTTLFRYVFRQLALTPTGVDAPSRARSARILPVRVTWSRLQGSDDLLKQLEEVIRADLLWGLISSDLTKRNRWDPETKYARLIGALSSGRKVEAQRQALEPLVAQDDRNQPEPTAPRLNWEKISEVAPRLVEQPLSTLLQTLWHDLKIHALLMFDLSPGEQGDATRGKLDQLTSDKLDLLTVHIKDLQEHGDGAQSGPWFSELYFMDRDTLNFINSVFDRSPEIIEYPHFEQADIFAILTRHYPLYPLVEVLAPNEPKRTYYTEDLAAVFHSDFLSGIRQELSQQRKSFKDVSLVEIVTMLEKRILAKMEKPWSDISYHLTPGPI